MPEVAYISPQPGNSPSPSQLKSPDRFPVRLYAADFRASALRRTWMGRIVCFSASVWRLAAFAPFAPDPGSAYYNAGRLPTVMASCFSWAVRVLGVIFASPIQPTLPGARAACFFNSTAAARNFSTSRRNWSEVGLTWSTATMMPQAGC
jgi:hypothetical protein